MFDISNPQNRERLLVVFAGVILCGIVIGVVPAQFRAISNAKADKAKLVNDINEHKRHARNQNEIQSRLSTMELQALAAAGTPTGSEALVGYQTWLSDLTASVGLRNGSVTAPTNSGGGKNAPYSKHLFTVTGEGQLNQIAEFLRRFHRTEYLHTIQQVLPRPVSNRAGEFNVTFRVEALSLPQVKLVNMPSSERFARTEDERQMLAAIQSRAILSEYVPPRPLVVSTRTPDSIALTWPPKDDADSHEIRYKKRVEPNTAWTTLEFTETAGTVSALDASTEYEFQIRAIKVAGPDAWTSSVSATTLPPEVIIPDFDEIPFCFLNGVVEVDGRPQCWINLRTSGRTYFLFEEGAFRLGGVLCVIKKIDQAGQQIHVNIGGTLFALRVGNHFDAIEAIPVPPIAGPEI